MLRVGLTGDLGSGKSTVAHLLAEQGAVVLSADEIARAMMEPGEHVHRAIVEHFGTSVLQAEGRLDRAALARLAFDPAQPRVEELNAIVHPAVLAAQEREVERLQGAQPGAIVVVESALIFSAKASASKATDALEQPVPAEPWRARFDCIVVVTAPTELKVERFVNRVASVRAIFQGEREQLEAEATRRLGVQAKTAVPEDESILTLANEGNQAALEQRVALLWKELQRRARAMVA